MYYAYIPILITSGYMYTVTQKTEGTTMLPFVTVPFLLLYSALYLRKIDSSIKQHIRLAIEHFLSVNLPHSAIIAMHPLLIGIIC